MNYTPTLNSVVISPLALCILERACWHFDMDSWIFPCIMQSSKCRILYNDSRRFLPTSCNCVGV